MKDQHKLIKGYRDLTQAEIDLMNRIKEHAENTKNLLVEVQSLRESEVTDSENFAESMRCLEIAKEHLQTGQMWFVRAVALPNSF